MKEKIRKAFKEIKKRWGYSWCYTQMEYQYKAVFNMCEGKGLPKCKDCPYYREVRNKCQNTNS